MGRGRVLQALPDLRVQKGQVGRHLNGVVIPAASPVPTVKTSSLTLGYRPLGFEESQHPGGAQLGRPGPWVWLGMAFLRWEGWW